MRYVTTALCGLALLMPTATFAQKTLTRNIVAAPAESTQLTERAQKIVSSKDFEEAMRMNDVTKMNRLLEGTGATATTPVAIFYCLPPAVPVFVNGQGGCQTGRNWIHVHPYMYAR